MTWFSNDRAVGISENPRGGDRVLKWGFTRTFHGNQDATLEKMSELNL